MCMGGNLLTAFQMEKIQVITGINFFFFTFDDSPVMRTKSTQSWGTFFPGVAYLHIIIKQHTIKRPPSILKKGNIFEKKCIPKT